MKSFKHSGDLGDIVSSLPTVRVAGGGTFYLSKAPFTRTPSGESVLYNVAPLLKTQHYITDVKLYQGEPVTFDLDRFRAVGEARDNIAARHLRAFSFPGSECDVPWLDVKPNPVAPFVFNATARYRNPRFPWKQIRDYCGTDAIFVGTLEEHRAFERSYGTIKYCSTENLLEVAEVIAGAEVFVGNQSCAFWIAEGLKKTIVQEVFLQYPNCLFYRSGFFPVKFGNEELPRKLNGISREVEVVLPESVTPPQNDVQLSKVVRPRTCLVQIGFYGDILNILPVAKAIADRDGGRVAMVVHYDYLDILEAVSYVEPVVWKGAKLDGLGAAKAVKGQFTDVIISRLPARELPQEHKCEAFNMESWRHAGYLDQWATLPPLYLDRRSFARESRLLDDYALRGKNFILVNPTGNSSPFDRADELLGEIHARWGTRAVIVDMRRVRAKKFQDLLGLMDHSLGIVTADTGTLHLAAATKAPVIALISDCNGSWHGSKLRFPTELQIRYREFQSRKSEILSVIGNWIEANDRLSGKSRQHLVFYHSGDLGDVLYSLPTVRALGGGAMFLGPDQHKLMGTREVMTPSRAGMLVRLLEAQPFISKAMYRPSSIPSDVNLNDFRDEMIYGKQFDLRPGYNLARLPLRHWNLPLELDRAPWLTAHPRRVASVVISRSSRYHSPEFNWKNVLSKYSGKLVFVGLKDEHDDFCRNFGSVPYAPTGDLYEAACIIAGADLFVGNQSCPLAIAVGLGKHIVLEEYVQASNCVFNRPNFLRGSSNLPSIENISSALTVTAPVENFTGFGQLTHAICSGLVSRNVRFTVNPFYLTEGFAPISDEIRKRLSTSRSERSLLICAILEVADRLAHGDVLMTMWEATRIDQRQVTAINERATCVIVPTKWNADCFTESGVRAPIRIVNLGVDPRFYHYIQPKASPVFRFGTAGRLAHAGVRKGVEETIACFQAAFPSETDVELHIKIFEDCKLKEEPHDKRIVLHRKFMPTETLVDWYSSLDCFVTLTKGEGWGLHIQQAMVIGRPVIVPRQGGQSEFVTEDNAYCCRFEMRPPDWSVYVGSGEWCIPDVQHCVELMRYVYTHRAEAIALGKHASETVAPLTWEKTADGVIVVLKEFGKL